MRKVIFIFSLVMCSVAVSAQTTNPFPTTDSLRKFINKWIRNSAVDAFTNLRLNTALIGVTRFIDSSDANGKLSLSDTATMLAGYTRLSRFMDSVAALRSAIAGAGAGPTGPENSLQYKSGSIFVGDAGLIYNAATNTLTTDSILLKKWAADSARFSNQVFKAPINTIYAFGNSNTVGVGASIQRRGYIYQIADTLQTQLYNYAVGGSGIRLSVARHNQYVSGVLNNGSTFVMTGYNDVANQSANPNIIRTYNKVIHGLKAMWLNHFANEYIDGTSDVLTRSGTWTLNQDATQWGGKTNRGAITSTLNDSIMWNFYGPAVGVAFIGGDSTTFNSSIADIFVDDVAVGSMNTNNLADGANLFPLGIDSRMPVAFFVTGLTNAYHRIKVVNKAARTLYVDYFATTSPNKGQFVVFNNIQYSAAAQQTVMNSKMDSLVLALPAGYPRLKISTNTVWNAGTGGNIDGVHPNDLGHLQIVKAFRNAHDSSITHTEGTKFRVGPDEYVVSRTYKKLPNSGDLWNRNDGDMRVGGRVVLPLWGSLWQGYNRVLYTDSTKANTFLGPRSSESNTTGTFITSVGVGANAGNTDQGSVTAVGSYSLHLNKGGGNTAVGANSQYANNGGSGNTSIGTFSLRNNLTGNRNTSLGQSASFQATAASDIAVVGYEAFRNATGWYNTGVGSGTHNSLTSGQGNIGLGPFAGANLTDGNYNTNISYQGYYPNASGTGQLNIVNYLYGTNMQGTLGTISAGRLGMHTKTPRFGLDLDGSFGITKDSVKIITAIGSNYIPTLDTTTDEIKRILPSALVTTTNNLSSGNTAARPGSPVAGNIRWNTDSVRAEVYTGSKWITLLPGDIPISGGTPALTSNYIGYGVSGSLSGTSSYQFNGTTVTQEASGAANMVSNTAALGTTSGGAFNAFTSLLPTASGQQMGVINFGNRNGATATNIGASIEALSVAAHTNGSSYASELRFSTTASGATTPTSRMRILHNGNIGIGTSPTARLHLPAGTATAGTAPLKLTSGTNLTTAEPGALEYDGTNYYATTSDNVRKINVLSEVTSYSNGDLLIYNSGVWSRGVQTSFQIQNSTTSINIAQTVMRYFVKTSPGASNITLTIGANFVGQSIIIKKMDNGVGVVTINTSSGTIDGAASIQISTQYETVTLFWDGNNWLISSQ